MFICNAWELLLKAYMIKQFGESSIYFKDNPDRTLSLSDCIKKVFTNEKDPMRINLEKINELRNTSTHFITEEYEMVYVPLFQACVINFNDKMLEYHDIDMTEIVPQNFLTLSVSLKELNEAEISAKYPGAVSKKLFNTISAIERLEHSENQKFAITINLNHYITKKRNEADTIVHLARDGEEPVAYLKEVRDPHVLYPYKTSGAINTIHNALRRGNVTLLFHGTEKGFNQFHFSNVVKYYDIKNNPRFCWKNVVGDSKTEFFQYSQQAIDFIVSELKKDPANILDRISAHKKR